MTTTKRRSNFFSSTHSSLPHSSEDATAKTGEDRRRNRPHSSSLSRTSRIYVAFAGFSFIQAFVALGLGSWWPFMPTSFVPFSSLSLKGQEGNSSLSSRDLGNLHSQVPTTFLDDYYSRRHLYPLSENGSGQRNGTDRSDALPILLVGGSDGSGTRVVVNTLQRLGVPMVVDDQGTMDVHWSCLWLKRWIPLGFFEHRDFSELTRDGGCPSPHDFWSDDEHPHGWPLLVNFVVQKMRSVNYHWEDFSACDQRMIESLLKPCVAEYDQKAEKRREEDDFLSSQQATAVRYGMKAPVSFLLLPILHHAYGRVKFLHVVRDGRDVCLSSNTSPVDKFYRSFYANATQREQNLMEWAQRTTTGARLAAVHPIMAIQLWNDWNAQVLEWERSMAINDTNGMHSFGEPSFDYMVVRTEDLIDPTTRLAIVHQIADFVGSQINSMELCCLAQQSTTDMGKSGFFEIFSYQETRQEKDEQASNNTQRDHWQGNLRHRNHVDKRSTTTERKLNPHKEHPHREIKLSTQKRQRTPEEIAHLQRVGHHFHKTPSHRNHPHHRTLQEVRDVMNVGNISLTDTMPQAFAAKSKDSLMFIPGDPESLARFRKDRFVEAFHKQHRDSVRNREHLDPDATHQVWKRYGKWMHMLEAYPELRDVLKKEAADGLEVFGYESTTPFADLSRASQQSSCNQELTCAENDTS